jgi:hypothetical protein
MELTNSQRWLLLAPPIVCLSAVILFWIYTEFSFGNLTWLFPVGDGPIPAHNEPAMSPGMKIIAKTPACDLIITAGKGLKRSYTWEGATRSVEMIPRPERWDGSFGLYFPGPGDHWFPHHGVTRCIADEGQMNFSSLRKAMDWLSETPGFQPRLYRNDGLVVWVDKNQALGVDVYQIYINGKKPTKLVGAEDDKISVVAERSIPATTSAPSDSNEFNEKNASYRAEKMASDCFYPSFFGMAEDFYKDHKYKEALDCYDQAVFARPSVHIYLQRARCLLKLCRYEEEVESCHLASKLSPADVSIDAVLDEIDRAKKNEEQK